LRVVIDGSIWHIYWKGSSLYLRELWRALHALALPPDLSLIMLHPYWQNLKDDPYRSIGKHYQVKRSLLPMQRHQLRMLYWEQVVLPISAARLKPTLLHSNPSGPLFAPCPTVLTVHDIIPLVTTDYQSATGSRGLRLRAALSGKAIKQARMILTDSDYSKRDIIRVLNVPEQRIRVIPLAASDIYHPLNQQQQVAARARFELPDRYIFYIGGFERYKNVISLLQAYAALRTQIADPPPLVIAGQPPTAAESTLDPGMFPDIVGEAKRLGLGNMVPWLGRVSDEDKAALLAASTFTVFPSTYEGFGLVPLEAMASGAPLICSDRTSLPEVVGAAGILLDPTNVGKLSAAMVGLLDDPARQAELRLAGPRQAARFSWAQTAQQTLDAYIDAAQRRTGN
jgi:glycosyltransferase involved in cell wall biosynthesis